MIQAARYVVEEIGAECFIIGNYDQSPFTPAADLMGLDDFMVNLVVHESLV